MTTSHSTIDHQAVVGIDATLLRGRRMTGVERYTLKLLQEFTRLTLAAPSHGISGAALDFQLDLLLPRRLNPELSPLIDAFRQVQQSPFTNRIATDQVWLPAAARRAGLSLLHCPAFPAPLMHRGPVVMTIHDAVLWRFPETASKGGRYYYRHLYPRSLSHCRRVITVSESSKEDLVHYLGIEPDQIRVTHLGVDESFLDRSEPVELPKAVRDTPAYILAVGTLEPRKNLTALIEAFKRLRGKRRGDAKLVLVGRKGWAKELDLQGIQDDVILTGFVSDAELRALYRHATLFVLPSLYEGFGLPLLEAMASGAPSIASHVASLPEVGGDACLYADPHEPDDFAARIEKLLDDAGLQDRLRRAGPQRAAQFRWEQTAAQTLAVYKEVLMEL